MMGSQVMRCALRSRRLAVEIGDLHAFLGDHGKVAIGEKEKIAGVIEERGHVAGDEVFVFAEADDRGRSIARRDDLVRIVDRDHHQREHSGEFLDRLAHRFFQGRALALHRLPVCRKYFSIRWAMISVSVSVVNLWPSAINFFLSER